MVYVWMGLVWIEPKNIQIKCVAIAHSTVKVIPNQIAYKSSANPSGLYSE